MRHAKYVASWALVVSVGFFFRDATPVNAGIQAYSTSATTGNQAFGGNLGVDFNVNSTIVVTALGAYDSGGLPFSPGIDIGIFQRLPGGNPNTDFSGNLLSSVTISGSSGFVQGNYRFVDLSTPLILTPGFYDITAVGFNGTNLDLNENVSGDATQITTNDGGGLISFVGSGRFDGNPSLDYPSLTTDDQGFNTPANVFGGGSFLYAQPAAVPEPSALVISSMMAGIGCVGLICRRFKRSATAA